MIEIILATLATALLLAAWATAKEAKRRSDNKKWAKGAADAFFKAIEEDVRRKHREEE